VTVSRQSSTNLTARRRAGATLRMLALDVVVIALGVGLFWSVLRYDLPLGRYLAIKATALMLIGAFFLVYAMLRLVLGGRWTVPTVARAVMHEAIQLKVGIALLVILLLIIAAAPFVVGEGDKLQYRIQQFITYTLTLTFGVLGFMTILVSCSTLSSEIEGKQIFTVMSKPVNRGAYLLGKWLGLVLLNAMLLGLSGLAVYSFAVFFLQRQPAMDALDRVSIRSELFAARVATEPTPADAMADRIRRDAEQRLEHLRRNQGQAYIEERGGAEAVLEDYQRQAYTEWRSMGPWNQGRDISVFVFRQMLPARRHAEATLEVAVARRLAELDADVRDRMARDDDFAQTVRRRVTDQVRRVGFEGQYVQLQYKVKATGDTPDQETRLALLVNRQMEIGPRNVPVWVRMTETIPAALIDDQGRIELRVRNFNPDASISFPREQGMEMLYRVGDFGPNFVRALLVMWIKLAFIAAMGLAAATFLGFPVAVLLTLLIVGAATLSGFILEALDYYGRDPQGQTSVIELVIKYTALAFTKPLEQYDRYQTIQKLVEGRYIAWADVGRCAAWIGVLWTGLAGLIGWQVFRSRELARVQV
jgi:hypothetical protein